MAAYAFWNNKGGTGKTSLAFQAITTYANQHPGESVLVLDVCPQANLSELLLGGLEGKGSVNLQSLHAQKPRRSIGGYFQLRLPNPYSTPKVTVSDFLSKPSDFNGSVPINIQLLAGDPLLELQSNAIATLANAQIPATNTWLAILDWLRDFLAATEKPFDKVFIDCNPSFSMYTQIALATADFMVVPVMADDSSKRALQNAVSLVHGLQLPSPDYAMHSFTQRLTDAGRTIPRLHTIVRNRITQYMGPATAYAVVLESILEDVSALLKSNPEIFTFTDIKDGYVDVRDFQTTGVVAFAKAAPFYALSSGRHYIEGQEIQVKPEYLDNCKDAINPLVARLA
uniref:ATPase n=1 Tax=mine drainage metagenome TaxID=410659 RepID=E6Q755_9ZZZZ